MEKHAAELASSINKDIDSLECVLQKLDIPQDHKTELDNIVCDMKRMSNERTNFIDKAIYDLRHSNKELSQFAYVASHDLKAPLRAVYSLATWIEDDFAKGKDVTEYIHMLKPKIKRMDDLINGLLEFSRIGRVETELACVDANKIVRDAIEDVDNGNGRATIVMSLPKIKYNPIRLGQIFTNLISNAIKHHPDPDKCQVKIGYNCKCFRPVCPCDHHHGSRDNCWTFWVKDNGAGIDPKHHYKIWEIFQTLKPKEDTNSTGIGLSIVKRIVEENDGNVWLESELGKGATFCFSVVKDR